MLTKETLKSPKNFAENLTKTIEISEDSIEIHYKLGKIIGIGHYGTVKEAWSLKEPPTYVAIKILDLDQIEKTFKSICCEVSSLRQANHENIIKIHQVFMDKKHLYLILDFIEGVDLSDYICELGGLEETKSKYILLQILKTINYLHSIHICHRDIKLDNIMINQETLEIKLIDFGFATEFSEKECLKDTCGTPFYVAPEVMIGRYGKECDMWSIGIMAFYMLTGKYPFARNEDLKVCDSSIKNIRNFAKVSKEGADFVQKLLVKDPCQRMTAYEALSHPWIDIDGQSSTLISEINAEGLP